MEVLIGLSLLIITITSIIVFWNVLSKTSNQVEMSITKSFNETNLEIMRESQKLKQQYDALKQMYGGNLYTPDDIYILINQSGLRIESEKE